MPGLALSRHLADGTGLTRAVTGAVLGADAGTRPRRVLADLPEREQVMLYLRFYEGMTQSEIAKRLGISQMHVSRLLSRSLQALREAAEAD